MTDQTQSYSEEGLQSLVHRLRELDKKGYQPLTGAIGNKAADVISSQAEQIRKLEAACFDRNKIIEMQLFDKQSLEQQVAALQAKYDILSLSVAGEQAS